MIDLISRKVFGFAISILLARLLLPESYGVIALTIVFIAFTNIFILNGFNISLIRKENVKAVDYSTVMTMSLAFVTVINVIVFFCAPYVAQFYGISELCPVLRAMMFGLYFSAISAVVSAKATRELKFKQMAIPSFSSNALGGVVAVLIAYMGGGVWALVAQHVFSSFVLMVWMMILFKFPMSLNYSMEVVRGHFKFSIGVIGTSFLEFIGNHTNCLVVGKVYQSKGLGYYDRAGVMPEMISTNLAGAVSNVLLPTLAKHQNDKEYVKTLTRKTISLSFFIIIPIMFGLIGSAKVFVPVMMTEKWAPMIPLLILSCLFYAISPLRIIEYGLLYSIGRSDCAVKVEMLRTVLVVLGVFIVALILKMSLFCVVFANLIICCIVSLFIHQYVKSIIGYTYKELIIDVLPSFVISIVLMIILLFISSFLKTTWVTLLIQVIIGTGFYLLSALITKNKNLLYLKTYIRR